MKKFIAATAIFFTLGFSAFADMWHVRSETNILTNEKETTLVLSSEEKDGPRLIIRCIGKKLDFILGTDKFLGLSKEVSVSYRIDEKPLRNQLWSSSTNHKAAFSKRPAQMVEMLAHSSTFIVGFTPYGERTNAHSFDVSDLKNHIQHLKGCGL